jgi:hypothetical protein
MSAVVKHIRSGLLVEDMHDATHIAEVLLEFDVKTTVLNISFDLIIIMSIKHWREYLHIVLGLLFFN